MPAQPADELGAAAHDPRLGAAEELVAGERHEVGACGEGVAGKRLVGQRQQASGAEVVDERELVAARDGGQLAGRRALGEADGPEVRLVDPKDERGALPDRGLVVGSARAVRRADLDEPGPGAGEHVRDPEPVADLDQLAAGDDRLPPVRERGEGEEQRGGVVVEDDGVLGAREPAEERGEQVVPGSSASVGEVELEVGVPGGLADPLERGGGERRTAEIRVEDDARGVDHAAEPGRPSPAARAAARSATSPGSPPAAISSRAPASASRAASTAAGCERWASAGRAGKAVDRGQVAALHA